MPIGAVRKVAGDAVNFVPRTLDMFSEAPAAELPPRRRVPPPAHQQPAPEHALPVVTAGRQTALAHVTPEQMAQQLEAHPDFRVLRRLQPRLEWPPAAPGAGVTRVVVLDTETTGLDQSREQIIELAMLCVDVDNASGLPVGSVQVYDGLEDPGKPIPAEVVAITGIHDADVQGQALDEARILALLERVGLVIAHNAGFDRPFVERRLPRFANVPWACSFADIGWKAQGRGSAKLESLAQAQGWFYDAHRAEVDCHALLAVLAAPLPLGGGTGLSQLIRVAAQPSYTLQATQAPFETKDALKARGYRWNAEQRAWYTRLAGEALLAAEYEWLRLNVYGQRSATVSVEVLDARVRYSTRRGVVRQQPI